jgi:citrate synthase
MMNAANRKGTDNLDALLKSLGKRAIEGNRIAPGLHDNFNVKRGLRNADGTGVLVSLTQIGEVHGYVIDENEKTPVDGVLRYRGYDVCSLIEGIRQEGRFGFEEICYLLLFGHLPRRDELQAFTELIDHHRELPAGFVEDMILKQPSRDIMNKIARSTLVSYSYDPLPDDISIANVIRQSIIMIAKFPAFAAYGYQALARYYEGKSLFLHSPKQELSTAENILRMIRPTAQYTVLEAQILDLALMLHAEHGGGNNSTFAVRVVTSTDTDTYSAIAAALGSLKGPKHGGANIKVMQMLADLKANVENWNEDAAVARYLTALLRQEAFDRAGLVYGMGHPVYTLSDPRAIILKAWARKLAEEKGREAEYELVARIERLTPDLLARHRGREAPLCANVDLYSGMVYSMLDIPESLYTPLFAIARLPGWCAHRVEELINGGRIIRPASKNVLRRRDYVPLDARDTTPGENP